MFKRVGGKSSQFGIFGALKQNTREASLTQAKVLCSEILYFQKLGKEQKCPLVNENTLECTGCCTEHNINNFTKYVRRRDLMYRDNFLYFGNIDKDIIENRSRVSLGSGATVMCHQFPSGLW